MLALWRNSHPMIGMLVVVCMRGLVSPGVSIQVSLFNSSLPFARLSCVRLHIASLVCSLCVYLFFALSRHSISIRDLRSLFNYLLHAYPLNSLLADLPSHRTFASSLL